MRQREKTQRTQERILTAALVEFGEKGYEAASINVICAESQIPKGLLYHNFKGKDDLYLQCVKSCYNQMTEYLSSQERTCHNVREDTKMLLTLRQRFFSDHPYHANLFFRTLLQPPKHLLSQLKEARGDFDSFCITHYRNTLASLSLRNGVTEEMALEYFTIFMEMFNGYFQSKADQGSDYKALMSAHEEKLFEILDVMLYGIVKQD